MTTLPARLVAAALAAGLLPLAATPVVAQTPGPAAHFIENWDLDGDGAVTADEAARKRDELFTMFDADEDDQLNLDEWALFDETRRADLQTNMTEVDKASMAGLAAGFARPFNDPDGDGAVTREEFVGRAGPALEAMDHDGDGVLTGADFVPAAP